MLKYGWSEKAQNQQFACLKTCIVILRLMYGWKTKCQTLKWSTKVLSKDVQLRVSYLISKGSNIEGLVEIMQPKGIKIEGSKRMETVLFADDQVVMAEAEDDLRRAVNSHVQIAQLYIDWKN